MQGTNIGARIKVTNFLTQYEGFKAKDGEMLEQTYTRYCSLLNNLRKNNLPKQNLEINIKFLTNLKPEWKHFSSNIMQNKDLEEMDIHSVFENLIQNEEEAMATKEVQKIVEKKVVEPTSDPLALLSEKRHSSKTAKNKANAKSQSDEDKESDRDSDEEVK